MAMTKGVVGFLGRSMQKSNYAYSNARVRVRRSKLLARESYAKLLKMEIPEIARFLEATTYGKDIDELASKFSGIDLLENALNVNEERDYAEIRSFAKGEVGELVGRYLDRWVHGNIKTILRGRSWGASPEQILRELLVENRANFDFYNTLIRAEGEGVRAVVDALGSAPFGVPYQRVLREAETDVKDEEFLLQAYEDALDRSYYTELLDSIRPDTQENVLFLKFVRKEIDAKNLEILLRFRRRGEGGMEILDRLLPPGQEFKAADLRRLTESANLAELVDRLKDFPTYQELRAEFEALESQQTLTPILIALTKSVGDFAQRFGYRNPLSVLPVINYLMRKNLEVRNLRAIARGKQAGLTEAEIENLLVVI